MSTVQRWAKGEGLPIHRDEQARGAVIAYRAELDAWWANRTRGPREDTTSGDDDEREARPLSATEEPRIPLTQLSGRLHRQIGFRRAAWVCLFVAAALAALVALRSGPRPDAVARAPVLVHRLTATDEAEWRPDLSPDGSELAFASWSPSESAIWIKPVDERPARRLVTLSPGNFAGQGYPTWSPDGRWLAFLKEVESGTRDVHLVPAAGGASRLVARIKGVSLAWTRDGQALVVADRPADGDPFSLFVIGRDGHRLRRLTTPLQSSVGDLWLAVSPDGGRVAFARYTSWAEADVYVMALSGGEPRRVTFDDQPIEGLAWMPAGHSVVVSWAKEGISRLWEVPIDDTEGAEPTLLEAPERGAKVPSAVRRPDGTVRIAYALSVDDVNIWRLRVGDDEAHREPVASSTYFEDYPAVSPDGRRLAFSSNRSGPTEVWVADLDGTNPTQVTFRNGPLCMAPRWSPDGRKLAFGSVTGGNRDIFVVGLEGGAPRRLITEPSDEVNPTWSRDGRWIYFSSNRSGVNQLWRAPSAGGPAARVSAGEASEAHESFDGRRVFFVRGTDIPGLWSVPVGGGEERVEVEDVRQGLWAVTNNEVVFAVRNGPQPNDPYVLKSWDASTRRVREIARLGAVHLRPGFAATADGQTVFWTQSDGRGSDIFVTDLARR